MSKRNWFRRRKNKSPLHSTSQHHRRARFETLEDRRMLAGTFDAGSFDFSVSVRFDANETQLEQIRTAFSDASQILADATDGQHKFGTIRIVNDSGDPRTAEYWIHEQSGRASAPFAKYGLSGTHVNLYFPSNIGNSNAVDNAYTIAHEHIHHAYGIGDGYSGPKDDGTPFSLGGLPLDHPDKAENAPYLAGGDLATLNFSIMDAFSSRGGRFGGGTTYTLNELSVDSNHDEDDDTWQSDRNKKADGTGKSDWDTIRDSRFPATVPAGLPVDAPPPLHTVTFEDGVGGGFATMAVLDISDSMAHFFRLENAQAGAKQFVAYLEPQDTSFGVASFHTFASVTLPLIQLGDENAREEAFDAINSLVTIPFFGFPSTNIGAGLLAGLGEITDQPQHFSEKLIILLSDGEHNSGPEPASVIPQLNQEGVTVITVGVGNDLSSFGQAELQNIATQTGGQFFRLDNFTGPLARALFIKLALENSGNAPLHQSPQSIASGEVKETEVMVETGATRGTFVITNADPTDELTVSLESPSGIIITQPDAASDPNTDFISLSNSQGFKIVNPEAGTWKIITTAGTISTGQVNVLAFAKNDGVRLNASVVKNTLTFPESVVIHATPQYGGENVLGANVTGTATRPDGSMVPITLFDDGLSSHGDQQPGDGVYSAKFNNYSSNGNGTYSFDLTVENTNGTTFEGEPLFAFAGAPSNAAPVPPFIRLATTTAVVTGVPVELPPRADAGGAYTVDEGGNVLLDASATTDPNQLANTLVYAWDLDGDGVFGETASAAARGDETGVNPTFVATGLDGPSAATISLLVTDDGGLADTATGVITVNNVAPTIDPISVSPAVISEGQSVTVSGTYSDPALGVITETFSGTALWSDGVATLLTVDSTAGTFSTTRTFPDDHPQTGTPSDEFTVDITITDDDSGSDTQTSQIVTVNNVDPVIVDLVSDATFADKAAEGEPVNIFANFTDVGIPDTHEAKVDWGDGEIEMVTVNQGAGSGTVTGSHEYSSGGIFTITVTLTDDDTGTATADTTAVVTGVGLNDGVLYIIGTSDADEVSVNKFNKDNLKVHATFIAEEFRTFNSAGVDKIVAYLCEGDDELEISRHVPTPAIIHGGGDNDLLSAGDAPFHALSASDSASPWRSPHR